MGWSEIVENQVSHCAICRHSSQRPRRPVPLMRYTERLVDAGIEPPVGSRGDSYDNALAESVIGLFKTEVLGRCPRWDGFEALEFATLRWADWFDIDGCSVRSASCRPPSTRRATMSRPPSPDSHNSSSRDPGPIQFDASHSRAFRLTRLTGLDGGRCHDDCRHGEANDDAA